MAYHDDQPLDVRRCAPHQLGWLRRPELDTETIDVWERPDGALLAQAKGKPLVFEHLVLRPPQPATDDQR